MLIKNFVLSTRYRVERSSLPNNRGLILAWRVLVGMRRDDAAHLAAGVAYFALFSLFPLLLGIMAVLGIILNSEQMQQSFVTFVTANLPGMEAYVAANLDETVRFREALGIGAIAGMLWLGSAVFGAVSRAVNRAWGIRRDRPFYIAKPAQLVMIVIVGGLFLLSTAATSFVQLFYETVLAAPWRGTVLGLGLEQLALYLIPWVSTLTIFLLIYRFLPNCKTYWCYIWPGAIVAAVAFEGVKFMFVWYLDNVAVYTLIYGSLSSVIALLFWAYLSSMILMLGAEICVEYERLRRSIATKLPVKED